MEREARAPLTQWAASKARGLALAPCARIVARQSAHATSLKTHRQRRRLPKEHRTPPCWQKASDWNILAAKMDVRRHQEAGGPSAFECAKRRHPSDLRLRLIAEIEQSRTGGLRRVNPVLFAIWEGVDALLRMAGLARMTRTGGMRAARADAGAGEHAAAKSGAAPLGTAPHLPARAARVAARPAWGGRRGPSCLVIRARARMGALEDKPLRFQCDPHRAPATCGPPRPR